MRELTDNEIEQILYKLKAKMNSKTLKDYDIDILKNDIEVIAFDEYITQLNQGSLNSDLPQESVEKFEGTQAILPEIGNPELGRKVTIYEPKNVSKNRKKEAYKAEIMQQQSIDRRELERRSKLAEYSIINLKGKDGKYFSLLIDKNGKDVGIITYDENGTPSFNISSDIKDGIDTLILNSSLKNAPPKVLKREFYFRDIDSLVRAIEEEKIVPKDSREVSSRIAAATNILNGQYKNTDAEVALTLTDEEKAEKALLEQKAVTLMEEAETSKLETPEQQRDIAEEQLESEDLEEYTKNVQMQPEEAGEELDEEKEIEDVEYEGALKEDEEEQEEEEENELIPDEKQEEIEEFCRTQDIDIKTIKSVLVIKDAQPLADCTEKSNIDGKGGEVTVLQFSDVSGKPKYRMIQEGAELGGDAHDESFRNLIEPLRRTSGTIKRVEDNVSTLDYTDSTGEIKTMKFKRIPRDMSDQQKDAFKEKLEKDLKRLEMEREENPENKALIDQLELDVYKDFVNAGLTPPQTIENDAKETIEENDKKSSNQSKKVREAKDNDDDCYDQDGRRISPYARRM